MSGQDQPPSNFTPEQQQELTKYLENIVKGNNQSDELKGVIQKQLSHT